MKIEKRIALKKTVNELNYAFICQEEAPLGAIWDVLTEMRSVILHKMQAEEKNSKKDNKEILEQEV